MLKSKKVSDEEAMKMEGQFVDLNFYDEVIDESTDVYIEKDGEIKLLFSLRKAVIPDNISKIAYDSYIKHVRRCKTNSRGKASGMVDIKKLSSNVCEVLDKDRFKSRVRFKNGKISKYKVCNNVKSMIAGFYDKPCRNVRNKNIACTTIGRETAFVKNHKDDWLNSVEYIKYIDDLYSKIYPTQYLKQKELIEGCEPYVIDNTIFSTVTLNYNFRTAVHKDRGDIKDGYSAFTICSKGDWDGFYLGYPQYKLCINVKQGDFVIMNPHEFHGNTEIINSDKEYERMSMVFYFREGLLQRK